jgi:hypothetical protein
MQAIKLVAGVAPTCWRPAYGDVDVSVSILPMPTQDRHILRVQDRIRAIDNALGLQKLMWEYDSGDWMVGISGFIVSNIDANYQLFVSNEISGTFDTSGAIMFTHELNNLTISEAI